MQRFCFALVGLILTLGPLLVGASSAAADSTPSPAQAVQQLNEWRADVGVLPVTEDLQQSEGCRAHANYYRLNHQVGHYEDPSLPGYTEAGDQAAASSVLSYGGAEYGPRTWEASVYHRAGLLNPRLQTTGFWSEFELGCMGVFGINNARTTPSLVGYTYPANGQQAVYPTFDCAEEPNPCESVPGNDGTEATGFISSVQFNGPWPHILGARVDSAQLTNSGIPVPITVEAIGDGTSGFLHGGFDVIPNEPLKEGTWYSANATGTVEALGSESEELSVPFSVAWQFKTLVVPRDPGLAISVTGGRPRISSNNPEPVELTVKDGGTHRFSIQLRSKESGGYQATAPTHRLHTVRWRICATQPADAGGFWKSGRTCSRGTPLSLDADVLYSSKYLVRLRIKAPALAVERRAQLAMTTSDGRSPLRKKIVLKPKLRVDLPGVPASGAKLQVSVKPFTKQGIPQRVEVVSRRINWSTTR